MLGPDKSIGWHTIIVLMLPTFATYGRCSPCYGAKYFGATRGERLARIWALNSSSAYRPFVGPVIGAIIGEVIAGKRMIRTLAGRGGEVCEGTLAPYSPSSSSRWQ